MEIIESFKIDHLKLKSGLYVSRKDRFDGTIITTFDMRFVAPTSGNFMSVAAMHTIEHLGATFFRNSALKTRVVYFGPMGCRTGFYLLLAGDYNPENIYPDVLSFCKFVEDYAGEIVGATAVCCGNYKEHDLSLAKRLVKEYENNLINDKNFLYPL